jgi:serine-type D-Ala-D-Ala carboxypeptidase/endopeptidase (penicillin-binding protein 4)
MRLSYYLRSGFFSLIFLGAQLAHAALPAPVMQALADAGIPEDSVAIVVQPVAETAPALSHQAEAPLNPASVMKLLTTYVALETLGPAYTWKTEAAADRAAQKGLLKGDLYIKGYGDPKLTIDQLWLFLKRIRAAGVKVITGDVVLDSSYFAPHAHESGRFDDKPMRAYNVGPDALLINYNAVNINLSADASAKNVRVWMEPEFRALKLINRLTLDAAPCGNWKDRINMTVDGKGDARRLQLTGKFSIDCGERSYALSLLTPEDFARGLFLDLWRGMGGKLAGRVRIGETPPTATVLARLESPALSELIRDMNKWSNNVMARQLFLTLGAEIAGAPAAEEKSLAVISGWLSGKGLHFPELVVENGSGLSRAEKISAKHMAALLISAWRSPLMPEFIASLPIVAIDGTMRKRLKGNGAAGRAHIKTGTLDGVKTLAGYVQDKNGREVVVVSFVNHPNADYARAAEDALLDWVYEGAAQ